MHLFIYFVINYYINIILTANSDKNKTENNKKIKQNFLFKSLKKN